MFDPIRLKLFTDAAVLHRVNRMLLKRFLEDFKNSLPAEAAALLEVRLDFDEFCASWAARFASSDFPAPMLRALHAIEQLSRPENTAQLEATIAQAPPNYVNLKASPLNQALHLWIIATAMPDVVRFPMPALQEPAPPPPAEQPSPDPPPAPPVSDQPKIEIPNSEVNRPIHSANDTPVEVTIPSSTTTPATEQSKTENQNPNTDPEAATFQRLARLSLPEYDRARRAEAKRLGLRLATLDLEVQRCRALALDAEANAIVFPELQPWPEPILDAPALFDAVAERFVLHLFLPNGGAEVFTIWVPHAHAINAFHLSPRLNLFSIEHGCGKTTAIDLTATMVPRPLRTESLKPAVVFRVVHRDQPTVFMDELDCYLHLYSELRGLINAGHKSDSQALRCHGSHDVRAYRAFCPTILAGIGYLPPTIRDRSIIIPMQKARPGQVQLRFNPNRVTLEKELGRKVARWVKDNFAAIAAFDDPSLPPIASNRLADNWRPLFTIAHLIGAHWPQRITDAFYALNTARHQHPSTISHPCAASSVLPPPPFNPQPSTTNSQPPPPFKPQPSTIDPQPLLPSIRSLFTQAGADRMFTRDLVAHLNSLPDHPWNGAANGHLVTERSLAAALRPLGIQPRTLWLNGTSAKGYLQADFPPAPDQSPQSSPPSSTTSPQAP